VDVSTNVFFRKSFPPMSSFLFRIAVFVNHIFGFFFVPSKQNSIPINLELSLSSEDSADNS
jgi:hypothetical protein